MRILHVIPNIERGGAERVMLMLARGLARAGHDVQVVVLGWKNEYSGEIGDEIQVRLLQYPLSYRRVALTWKCLLQVRRTVMEYRPDIVHSHLWPAARMAGWALRGEPTPHIVHIHDTMGWLSQADFRSRSLRLLTRSALNWPNTHFIAVGQSIADYTKRLLPWIRDGIPVIHNSFDADLFAELRDFPYRSPAKTLVFGSAARLVPNKGIDRCLRALARARIRGSWEYLIAGDGSQRGAWDALARDLGIADRVRFLGTVTNMPSFYRQLDVYIQPSLALEGLPLVLAEAMACGVPVIATDIGSTCELVRNEIDGIVIPPDNVPALTQAIESLASNPNIRYRMALSAHERAWSEFSSKRMVQRVMMFYEQVLAEGGYRSSGKS